jgi:Tfp pilus assembly protein PilN
MIEVNLLPREYRKRATTFRFDKKVIYSAIGAGVVVLLLIGVTFHQKYQLSSLDQNIAKASAEKSRLQEDIKLIDGLTELKEKIILRMEAIEKLDRYRSTWVNVLQDLNVRVPDFLWLTRVAGSEEAGGVQPAPRKVPGQEAADTTQTKEFVMFDKPVPTEIEGYAFTLNSVASFLVGLMKSDYFDNINLAFAKEEEVQGISAYRFKLMCDLVFDKALDQMEPMEDVWSPGIAER